MRRGGVERLKARWIDAWRFNASRLTVRRFTVIRFTVTLALALFAAGLLAAGAGAKVIGHGTLLKGHPIAVAQATARAPAGIALTITAVPRQPVKVDWTLVCSNGKSNTDAPGAPTPTNAGAESSGVFTAAAPLTRALALPFAHPPYCVVTVYGTLSRKGTELIQITQR